MNASAFPTVGSRMSPRGSFGFGSIANLHAVALLAHVLAEQVQALGVPVEGGPDVLGRPRFRALAPAPEDVGLRAQVRRQVEVPHHLGQREPPDLPVVGGERPVPEHRVAEQVGGGGGHDQPGLGQRLAERGDALVPLGRGGVEGEHVVVVEVHPVGAEFGQLVHGPLGGHGRPHGRAEHIHSLPAHRPDAEREAVLARGNEISAHQPVPFLSCLQYPMLSRPPPRPRPHSHDREQFGTLFVPNCSRS